MAEMAIRQIWSRQASAAVALLLNRGIRNLRANQPDDALEDFDAAITLAPLVADAWHWRAQAYQMSATGQPRRVTCANVCGWSPGISPR